MSAARAFVANGVSFVGAELLGRAEWTPEWSPGQLASTLGAVVITGGAGSIGGALATRLVQEGAEVWITDADERAMDLLARTLAPGSKCHYRLCDVCDAVAVGEILAETNARTIFHLAAKKHVKYAEHAVRNAVLTNLVGTWNVLDAARALPGCPRVICASSDKAVAATNVLGLTKRAAEQLTTAFAADHPGQRIASVRLCNVLGTAGNVLDHYVDEARRGVTLDVWSRDMSRYFCTVHEAVDQFLVAALDRDAAVLTLDPGAPTLIADLAQRACEVLRSQGLDARFEISECFAPIHARHEHLWGEHESVQRPPQPPALATISYPPAKLPPLEALLTGAALPVGNPAMRTWLDGFLAAAG